MQRAIRSSKYLPPEIWCDVVNLANVSQTTRRKAAAQEISVNSQEQFCDLTYAYQMHTAERELSAFISAVTQLYGSEEAKISAEDWLDELADNPSLSTGQDWRAVTIAASARLANRLTSNYLIELTEIA
jgi:hypothetical protein